MNYQILFRGENLNQLARSSFTLNHGSNPPTFLAIISHLFSIIYLLPSKINMLLLEQQSFLELEMKAS